MCLVTQSCLSLCDPMVCRPSGSSVHGESPGRCTGVGCHALLQGIFPTQGSKPRSPTLQTDSLLSEPPGKPYIQITSCEMARLDEAQAGIKIAGRNINNLRYADDTTLLAGREELNSLLMKVKEESEWQKVKN